MNRRQLLKLITLGVVGHTLDIDRLLWVPGQKTIFIPKPISLSEIINIEMQRIILKIPHLFERDDTFYRFLDAHRNEDIEIVSNREIRVPFKIKL